MRTLRHAFVLTIASAACTRGAPPPVEPTREPTHNPPAIPPPAAMNPPVPTPAATCPPRDTLRGGAPCTTPGLGCYLPTDGCQPSGFQCEGGVWREVTVTCNPPPPPRS